MDKYDNKYTNIGGRDIYCDLDGCLAEMSSPHPGKPIKGAKEVLSSMRQMGYKILVHSSRTSHFWKPLFGQNQLDQVKIIERFMEEHNIEYDGICLLEKPVARYIIDDRSLLFTGDWEDTLKDLIKKEVENGNR